MTNRTSINRRGNVGADAETPQGRYQAPHQGGPSAGPCIAIVGSREFPDPERVREFVLNLPTNTIVGSGAARGVDRVAAATARARHLQVLEYPAQWDRYGRSAGYIRRVPRLPLLAGDLLGQAEPLAEPSVERTADPRVHWYLEAGEEALGTGELGRLPPIGRPDRDPV